MSRNTKVALSIAGIVTFAVVLWFFFPVFAVFIEGAALNLRRFWWLVLLVVMAIWVVWVLRNRNPG